MAERLKAFLIPIDNFSVAAELFIYLYWMLLRSALSAAHNIGTKSVYFDNGPYDSDCLAQSNLSLADFKGSLHSCMFIGTVNCWSKSFSFGS